MMPAEYNEAALPACTQNSTGLCLPVLLQDRTKPELGLQVQVCGALCSPVSKVLVDNS